MQFVNLAIKSGVTWLQTTAELPWNKFLAIITVHNCNFIPLKNLLRKGKSGTKVTFRESWLKPPNHNQVRPYKRVMKMSSDFHLAQLV